MLVILGCNIDLSAQRKVANYTSNDRTNLASIPKVDSPVSTLPNKAVNNMGHLHNPLDLSRLARTSGCCKRLFKKNASRAWFLLMTQDWIFMQTVRLLR